MSAMVERIEERLKELLLSVMKEPVEPDRIRPDVALMHEGLSLDSVTLLEFVVGIENEFKIIVDDGVMTREHFETLGALARAVQAEIERQNRG